MKLADRIQMYDEVFAIAPTINSVPLSSLISHANITCLTLSYLAGSQPSNCSYQHDNSRALSSPLNRLVNRALENPNVQNVYCSTDYLSMNVSGFSRLAAHTSRFYLHALDPHRRF